MAVSMAHIQLPEDLGIEDAILPGDPARVDRVAALLEQPEELMFNREYNRVNAAVNADAFANAMLPEMAPYLERYPLLDKSVYSSFSIPKVREAAARADRVVVTGVVAECCVLSTVLAGIDLGHRMVYLTDAVAGVTPESEAQAEAIVSYLTVPHTEVLTTGAYLEQSR